MTKLFPAGILLAGALALLLPASNVTSAERVIPIPDAQRGQVLKFEFCKAGDCDRSDRRRWGTHYIVPPPGVVCRLSDITAALHWIEQHRPGWLLAGWGCVSHARISI